MHKVNIKTLYYKFFIEFFVTSNSRISGFGIKTSFYSGLIIFCIICALRFLSLVKIIIKINFSKDTYFYNLGREIFSWISKSWGSKSTFTFFEVIVLWPFVVSKLQWWFVNCIVLQSNKFKFDIIISIIWFSFFKNFFFSSIGKSLYSWKYNLNRFLNIIEDIIVKNTYALVLCF